MDPPILLDKSDFDNLFVNLKSINFTEPSIYNNICSVLKNVEPENLHHTFKIWKEWFIKNNKEENNSNLFKKIWDDCKIVFQRFF